MPTATPERERPRAVLRRRPARNIAALTARVLTPALSLLTAWSFAATNTTVHVPPNWSLDGAEGRDNGLRGEYVLNGTWRYQPYPPAAAATVDVAVALFRNVPCHKRQTHVEEFFILDSRGQKVTAVPHPQTGRPTALSGIEPCLLEREFVIPPAWQGRRCFVEFVGVEGDGRLFVNGKFCGHLWDWVAHAHELKVAPGELVRLTLACKAVPGDVWLRSYPAGPRVEETYLTCNWEPKTVGLRIHGAGAVTGLSWRLRIAEAPDFRELALETAPRPVRAEAAGHWSDEAHFAWPSAKPWNLEERHLYWYCVELMNASGAVVDRTLPRRFGFREFRIAGGDFLLNGNPTRLRALNTVAVNRGLGITGDARYLRQCLRWYKDMGANCISLWAAPQADESVVADVADEEGLLLIAFVVHFAPYAQMLDDAEVRRFLEARVASEVRRLREHPSLVIWFQHGVSHPWDYCPYKLDGSYDPLTIWPTVRRRAEVEAPAAELVRHYDGTRPISFHSGGNASVIHTSMAYMNYDTDLQEIENWPRRWARTRHKPLLPTEFGFPFNAALYTRVNRSNYATTGSRPLVVECAAMYLGEEPYRTEPEADIRAWYEREWTVHGVPGPNVRKVKALWAQHMLRAWRTYGISYQIHAEVNENNLEAAPLEVTFGDPRRRGAQADVILWKETARRIGPLGRAIRDNQADVLAYLGGSGPELGDFTRKDHVFAPGEVIEKTLVIVNDRPRPVTYHGLWRCTGPAARVVAEGPLTGTVAAGGILAGAKRIHFRAPSVPTRTELRLRLDLVVDGRTQSDELALTVLPPDRHPLRLVHPVYLYDPGGDSERVLRRAGVAYTPVHEHTGLPEPPALLVVGRRALEAPKGHTVLQRVGFDHFVSTGGRVLIFEQGTNRFLGLTTEETYTRRAFIAAPGHPVFAGLADSDFTYLRGDSDLTEPYPAPGPPPAENPLRFWKWGNDHVVSSFPLARPQLGACRALLVSGFDLMESPLLEAAVGRGRLVFCQVDVSNRYGHDPVSTRLVHNLLRYLDTAPEPDAARPLPLQPDDKLTGGLAFQTVEAVRFSPPPGRLGWGITAADLFFRQPVRARLPVGPDGVPAVVIAAEIGGDVVPVCGLNPDSLTNGWQKVKALRTLAALRINAGQTDVKGPSCGAAREPAALYPIEWREGFVHPYDYWRW